MTISFKTSERDRFAERDAHDRAINAHIGRRIRDARERAGLSHLDLGRRIGASSAKVAKYEQGALRLAARELLDIGRALGKPVNFFFQDIPETGRNAAPARPRVETGRIDTGRIDTGAARVRETESLIEAFENIEDDAARRDVMRLLREIAANLRMH
jgi:transcriptional regulator with XRE-family HTH domain